MKSIFLFLFLFFRVFLHAQNIPYDTTFNQKTGPDAWVNTSTGMPNGDVLVAGSFTEFAGQTRSKLAVIDSNGKLDYSTNFGAFTYSIAPYVSSIEAIAVQSNGKILIAGTFNTYGGIAVNGFIRLNTDGSIDPTFTTVYPLGSKISRVKCLPNGEIIIGGVLGQIQILNSDGTPNYSYITAIGQFSGSGGGIKCIQLASSGEILISGSFTYIYNGTQYFNFVKLDANYQYDPTFPNVYLSEFIGLTSQDKIVSRTGSGINRFNLNGTPDLSFSTVTVSGILSDLVVLPNDEIVYCGYSGTSNLVPFLKKCSANGGNSTITDHGLNTDLTIYNVDVNPDGKCLVSGNFKYFRNQSCYSMAFVDFSNDQTTFFNYSTGLSQGFAATKIGIQSSKKIVYSSFNCNYNQIPVASVSRLLENGYPDFTFNSGSGPGSGGTIQSLKVQSDDKVIVAGNFGQFSGSSNNKIVRLGINGAVDPSFNSALTAGGNGLRSLLIQPDGKYIIGGEFSTSTQTGVQEITRLNADGSLDPTFDPGTGPFLFGGQGIGVINDIEFSPGDTSFYIAGQFGQYNGANIQNIARIKPDGSLDLTFIPSNMLTSSSINKIEVQNDGKILACGTLSSYGGVSVHGVVRLLSNGNLDPTFVYNSNYASTAIHVSSSSSGKIYVTHLVGIIYHVEVLNQNGTVVWNYPSQSAYINEYELQYYDKAIVGGDNFSGNNIRRLRSCIPTSATQSISACDSYTWIDGNTYYSSTNTPSYVVSSSTACDTLMHLNLTIDSVHHENVFLNACDSLTWMNGITYYTSNFSDSFYLSSPTCDTLFLLNLTITLNQLDSINSFAQPSDTIGCNGVVAFDLYGDSPFVLDIDSTSSNISAVNYHLENNLCPGIHSLDLVDNCGDTTTFTFVVPIDTNYVYNNPYADSLVIDSLGITNNNCSVFYNSIDTAFIDSVIASGNNITVIWQIIDSSGIGYDTTNYTLNSGPGVYLLQMSVYCPAEYAGGYFTVTQAVYFNNGQVYTGLTSVLDYPILISLYPNPGSDVVNIDIGNHEAALNIFDASGKLLLISNVLFNKQISLAGYEQGVYFFVFKTNGYVQTKRFVKH